MRVATKTNPSVDHLFLVMLLLIVVFGLIMLTSASSPIGYAQFGDIYYFSKRQLLFGFLPGMTLLLLAARVQASWWKKISGLIYLVSLILLFLVFIPGIGLTINGARSWIGLFGLTFQPAELSKLALIMVMSTMLSDPKRDLTDWKNGLMPILIMTAPTILLIGLQPDIGTLSILAIIIFGLLFLAGVKKIYLAVLGLVGLLAFGSLLVVAPYRVDRLTTFLHPELDPKGVGYQINQSFLAIGSGGLWGLGYGHSRQKYQYLPEVQADSVFAIIAEETGFITCFLFIILVTFFGIRGLKIAKKAPDQFNRLLVGGIMIWFMWQFFLNIGSMIGLMPLTGVPLPFVSHGGSALMIALFSGGIVLAVSRQARLE